MPRRRRRIILIFFLLVFAYVGGQLWDIHRVGHLDRDRSADCAIVLGAAAWHDKPSPVLEERLNHAIDLYKNGKAGFLILTGGYGKGAKHAESEVGSDYCIRNGVPGSALRVEKESGNTIDNLREAKKIMADEQWESALLVSDPWHLKRARRMATDLDLKVYVSATPSSKFKSLKTKSKFLFDEFLLYHSYLLTGK
ncbi:YdcF family protein [bacterium]|nr:YdcF family protein [bacterium]